MKKFGAFLLIGAIGLYLYSRLGQAKNIKAVLLKISFGGNWLSPKIFVTLGIQNPNSQSVTVNSFTGELYSGNTAIADISSFEKTTIGANSETAYTITAVPRSVSVLTEIVKAITKNKISKTFNLKGALNVNNTTYPLNFNYNMT